MFAYVYKFFLLWLLGRYRVRRTVVPPIFCIPGDHIGDNIFLDGLHERDLLEATFSNILGKHLIRFMSSTCLDVGGNIGNHSVFFSKKFDKVYSFEPNPIFCLAFRATVALNGLPNVEIIEKGLGDTRAQLKYSMTSDRELGNSHFLGPTEVAGPERAMVLDIEVGDSLVSEMGVGEIALVKIDVEGFELAVLSGLRETIARHQPIILFESHPENDRDEAERVWGLLQGYGYRYFYTCQGARSQSQNKGMRLMYRILHGVNFKPFRVLKLEDREYQMLVASIQPIDC